MIKKLLTGASLALIVMLSSCSSTKNEETSVKKSGLIVVAPGHFHASLVQKSMYDEVDSVVHVYATEGPDLDAYLSKIDKFNTRPDNPTRWNEQVYKGDDFMDKMLAEKAGNIVVLAGNNKKKTEFIKKSIDAKLNVLADKPMAIDDAGFSLLKEAFAAAEKNNVLLYDIMTERYEITNTLQRELAQVGSIFGELQKGTPEDPAVVKESVHHFFKYVAGEPLVRPAWFFDVEQQGEGIVDVTTHLIDLIQWSSFPDQVINYQTEVELTNATRKATTMTPEQFKLVTKLDSYPDYLKKDVKDGVLNVYANGEINYKLKGVNAKVAVIWNYQAPEGTGDTHYSIMKGSKSNLVVRQGKEQNFKPVLFIESTNTTPEFIAEVESNFKALQAKYEGIELKKIPAGWQVVIPDHYETGHEAHFGEVTNKYMQFIKAGKLPEWEVPNMITKYYITTQALKLAKEQK